MTIIGALCNVFWTAVVWFVAARIAVWFLRNGLIFISLPFSDQSGEHVNVVILVFLFVGFTGTLYVWAGPSLFS